MNYSTGKLCSVHKSNERLAPSGAIAIFEATQGPDVETVLVLTASPAWGPNRW
jgi:hypothetical protein